MYFPYSCWIWNNGGEDKNIPNQGGIPKITRKKITLALLYINYYNRTKTTPLPLLMKAALKSL